MVIVRSNRTEWVKKANRLAHIFGQSLGYGVSGLENDLARGVRSMLGKQFRAQGRGQSGKWAPLAASTRKSKKGRKGILRRTDRLYNEARLGGKIQHGADSHGFFFIHSLETPYAVFHQRGTRKMPQRRIYDPTPAQGRALSAIISKAYIREFEKIGWADNKIRIRNAGMDKITVTDL